VQYLKYTNISLDISAKQNAFFNYTESVKHLTSMQRTLRYKQKKWNLLYTCRWY